uniref:Uncharacterized protein n=1 Tax=Anguilla anguilla TaxID=7936 RepID=A0A0E9RVG9_ANGAN
MDKNGLQHSNITPPTMRTTSSPSCNTWPKMWSGSTRD